MLYSKYLVYRWISNTMKGGSYKGRDRNQYAADSGSRGSSTSPSNILGLMFKPFSLFFPSSNEEKRISSPKKVQNPDYSAVKKEKQMMNSASMAAGRKSSSSSHLQSAGLSYINDKSIKSPPSSSGGLDKKAALVIPKPERKSGTSSTIITSNYDYLDANSKSRTPMSSASSSSSAVVSGRDGFSMVNPGYNSARRSLTAINSGSSATTSPTTSSPSVNASPGSNISSSTGYGTPSAATPMSSSSAGIAAAGTTAATAAAGGAKKVLCCDKCDGKHETENCPYYKKSRENHPDAQKNKLGGATSSLPGNVLKNARVARQPGDGSCLFHSMSYGLRSGNANTLRNEICTFIRNNPNFPISDTPLKDWVKWDSGASVEEYARNMSRGSWGGGIEMAVTSVLKGCNVHVYERSMLGFKRISAFDHPDNPASKPVVRVLYCGGVHYDALVMQ